FGAEMLRRRFRRLCGGREMDIAIREIDRRAGGFAGGAESIPFGAAENFEDQHGALPAPAGRLRQMKTGRKSAFWALSPQEAVFARLHKREKAAISGKLSRGPLWLRGGRCGRCVMVRPLPSKQETRVRFPPPAPVVSANT